jgi:ATP-dependent RNA helicase RhlE
MLDMGFLPDIRRILQQLPKKRQTLMFSATLSKEIESLTHEFQRTPKIVQIGKRANPAETVTQLVYELHKRIIFCYIFMWKCFIFYFYIYFS